MKKGGWIIIEGGEGSGKTTIAKWLVDKLNRERELAYYSREPGGSKVAEGIRQAFLNDHISPISQLFCFLAARAVWMEQVVAPTLNKRQILISDRSFPSSYVYQGVVGKLGLNFVIRLNKIACQEIKPNLVIILDVDPKTGLKRSIATGDINAFEKKSLAFHRKVNRGYLALAKKFGWQVIDANQPLEKVKQLTGVLIKEFT